MSEEKGTLRLKTGLAEMLKGGVIMDVTNAEQARIAEDAGAVAVMALERVPSDIRRDGGVARMSDPTIIKELRQSTGGRGFPVATVNGDCAVAIENESWGGVKALFR